MPVGRDFHHAGSLGRRADRPVRPPGYGTERPGKVDFVAAGTSRLLCARLAPWCLVCLVFDVRLVVALGGGDVGQAGLAVYAVLYSMHLSQVFPRMEPGDVAQGQGWVRFGGAGFLISTVQMNIWLLLGPQWLSAVYLVAALLGAATWSTVAGQRIAWGVVLYAVAFSVAGQAFNQYWGSLTAPLFAALGCCRGDGSCPVVASGWPGTLAATLGPPTLAAR